MARNAQWQAQAEIPLEETLAGEAGAAA